MRTLALVLLAAVDVGVALFSRPAVAVSSETLPQNNDLADLSKKVTDLEKKLNDLKKMFPSGTPGGSGLKCGTCLT